MRSPLNYAVRPAPISLCWWSPGGNCAKRSGKEQSGREAMTLTRRDLAAAGAFAFGTAVLAGSALAEGGDDAAVKKTVEDLKAAWLKQDKAKLEAMTSPQLTYSHSDARLEDKSK